MPTSTHANWYCPSCRTTRHARKFITAGDGVHCALALGATVLTFLLLPPLSVLAAAWLLLAVTLAVFTAKWRCAACGERRIITARQRLADMEAGIR
jgi:hypothetical protein